MTKRSADSFHNVGSCEEVPTVRHRWDNPVPMFCGHIATRAAGGYIGIHATGCHSNAFYVFLRGEDAVAFRCFNHKETVDHEA